MVGWMDGCGVVGRSGRSVGCSVDGGAFELFLIHIYIYLYTYTNTQQAVVKLIDPINQFSADKPNDAI